jgi:hypothetical protein
MISQQRNSEKKLEKILRTSYYGKELASFKKYLLILTQNEIKNHLINLTHEQGEYNITLPMSVYVQTK